MIFSDEDLKKTGGKVRSVSPPVASDREDQLARALNNLAAALAHRPQQPAPQVSVTTPVPEIHVEAPSVTVTPNINPQDPCGYEIEIMQFSPNGRIKRLRINPIHQ